MEELFRLRDNHRGEDFPPTPVPVLLHKTNACKDSSEFKKIATFFVQFPKYLLYVIASYIATLLV